MGLLTSISPAPNPQSEPWVSCVVGSEPWWSNSTSTSPKAPPLRARARRPIRNAAARLDLAGPRITGPITSLNELASISSAFPLPQTLYVRTGGRGDSLKSPAQSSAASGLVLAHFHKET
jgi:hypothetical protein